MTYTIIDWVKEHFDELLVNQPLKNEDLLATRVSDLDVSEKVRVLTKFA